MQKWKLASFDLDGTLISGTSSAQHLSGKMGDLQRIEEFEASYARGDISNVEFGDFDASRYRGYTRQEIYKHLEDVPLINHIAETVDYFTSREITCVISTMAWDFIAEFIAVKHGFNDWSGPTLEVAADGTFTGRIDKYFHETEKVSFVDSICARNGFSLSEVIHIGDSRSDYPLFAAAGFSIALNGNTEARNRAHKAVASTSLLDIKTVVPGL